VIDDPNLMFSLATIHEELGDREEALRWIDRCVEGGFPMPVIEDYPGFKDLRNDPRFEQLRRTGDDAPSAADGSRKGE
jgi:hypothetical protein